MARSTYHLISLPAIRHAYRVYLHRNRIYIYSMRVEMRLYFVSGSASFPRRQFVAFRPFISECVYVFLPSSRRCCAYGQNLVFGKCFLANSDEISYDHYHATSVRARIFLLSACARPPVRSLAIAPRARNI